MISYLLNLSRSTKRLLFLLADTLLVGIALYAAFALRYGQINPNADIGDSWVLFPLMMVLGAVLIHFFRLPQIKLNAFENRAMLQVGLTSVSLMLTAIVCSYMLGLAAPRSVPATFATLFFLLAVIGRVGALYLLRYIDDRSGQRTPVIIYTTLQGLMVAGLPVHPAKQIEKLITRHEVQRVLIAVPSLDKERRSGIIQALDTLPVEVLVMPSYVDMMSGNSPIDSLRPVSPDALLGRDKVDTIDRELQRMAEASGIPVTARLGSVTDKTRVASVIADEGVEIILHAAAYKHVPLVEDNPLEGARNNVIGTQTVAEAADAAGVERMIRAFS